MVFKCQSVALILLEVLAQRDQHIADSRTTKLYDRRGQKVLREDVEWIRY